MRSPVRTDTEKIAAALALVHRLDPAFRDRAAIYDATLVRLLTPDTVWLDLGCGANASVQECGDRARCAVGIDAEPPGPGMTRFVQADPRRLPVATASVDLVTMRFVVEHLAGAADLTDVVRVLKPGGRLLVITANAWCPLVALPRLLPATFRRALIRRFFGADSRETFHQFGTAAALRRLPSLACEELTYISDINPRTRWVFLVFLGWHLLTRVRPLNRFRAVLLAVLRRTG